jgi:hypothetical protein
MEKHLIQSIMSFYDIHNLVDIHSYHHLEQSSHKLALEQVNCGK